MPEKNFGSLRSAKSSQKFFLARFARHGCPNYRPTLCPADSANALALLFFIETKNGFYW